MSHRIVINVGRGDRLTDSESVSYSGIFVTPLTAVEVVDFIGFSEGFHAHIIDGNVLSFVDYSCISISPDYIISRLQELPTTTEEPCIQLPHRCTIQVSCESNDEMLPRSNHELVYILDRFECGASGYTETAIQWAMDHPIEMIFIAGFIWDCTKTVFLRICRPILRLFQRKQIKNSIPDEQITAISFSPRKFQNNVAKLMNLDKFYFQIIDISPAERGVHIVRVRTIKNEEFEVITKTNGKPVSLRRL